PDSRREKLSGARKIGEGSTGRAVLPLAQTRGLTCTTHRGTPPLWISLPSRRARTAHGFTPKRLPPLSKPSEQYFRQASCLEGPLSPATDMRSHRLRTG